MIHDSAITSYVNPGRAPWALTSVVNGLSPLRHTHPISDVIGLQTALNGRALSTHIHNQSDVRFLVSDLADKSPRGEFHVGLACSEPPTSY